MITSSLISTSNLMLMNECLVASASKMAMSMRVEMVAHERCEIVPMMHFITCSVIKMN